MDDSEALEAAFIKRRLPRHDSSPAFGRLRVSSDDEGEGGCRVTVSEECLYEVHVPHREVYPIYWEGPVYPVHH